MPLVCACCNRPKSDTIPAPPPGVCKKCSDWPCRCNNQAPARKADTPTHDPVEHPKHYTSHPVGIECIQVTEHMNFNVGNAVKYLWRCDMKGALLDDLKKARWYIDREIQRLSKW